VTNEIDRVINFWFNGIDEAGNITKSQQDKWFIKDEKFDQYIDQQFSTLVTNAANGQYQHWAESAIGRLALIISLDQFPRNIYRNQAQAFAYDNQALQLTLEGLNKRHDQTLLPIQRIFFYLPIMHAEDKAMQDLSMELYTQLSSLLPNSPDPLAYAKQHYDIIYQFGRYPHRNAVLERESTAEELEFLKTHGGF
jgi:uncharacterized protein (DUF924 family)